MTSRHIAMKFQQSTLRTFALAFYLQRGFVSAFATTTITPPSLARTVSTTALYSKKMDQSFPTWRYDKPCLSMDWSPVLDVPLIVEEYSKATVDDSDLVIIGVTAPSKSDESEDDEDKDPEVAALTGTALSLDEQLGGALTEILTENVKTFKNGAKMGGASPVVRVVSPGNKSKRFMLIGLGQPPKEDNKDPYLGAGTALGSSIASACNGQKKISSCSVILPEVLASNDTIMSDLSTAFFQTLYTDNRYRTGAKVKKPVEDLKSVKILSEGSIGTPESIEAGKKLATGVYLTKDIVNAPHNVLNSLSLAETAKRIAKESGGTIKCQILSKDECEKRGMGAFLGVARGSETEPQFIHLTYTPPSGKINKKVGIIGKGLLFDTGGYNIKTSMMELMKFDCGGAAAVLGAARAVGALAPEGVEAHFCVAACENMINEKAMVASDILTASNGKTIEVMNTDAEGRLTLADALVFADKELGCESIIELSTLTGACMISLGKKICGVWTDNDDLGKELEDISKVTGDKSWRMPMEKEYNQQLESTFADIKNVGTRYGGAITAALFLQNFVDKKKPYAHIDIAGPVWDDKIGATGFGAKLVVEWVKRQGQKGE